MKKIILITGVTSGFGLATARLFASSGWRVIGTGRREERLEAISRELGSDFLPIVLDMRNRDDVAGKLGNLPQGWEQIDVLVNNAGLALGVDSACIADLDDWNDMVDTNIKGVLYATRTILPVMKERNRGHIIFLGSIAGTYSYGGGTVYCGTKAFVRQFSLALRGDLLGTNIRVSNVEPGLAESEFSIVRYHGDAEKAGHVYDGTCPLTPQDIAETIFWIAARPAHVNINRVEIMPVCQAPQGARVVQGVDPYK